MEAIEATGSSDDYRDFLRAFGSNARSKVEPVKVVFTTDADELWRSYLDAMPPDERQHYTCHACRHFVERFGSLVTIDTETGRTTPVMWSSRPGGMYSDVFAVLDRIVSKSRVTGVFVSDAKEWGMLSNRDGKRPGVYWHHLHVSPPQHLVFRGSALRNASQVAAEKREEYAMLQRGLAEFGPAVVEQALGLLRSESLYRSEKVLGVADWMNRLHTARATARDSRAKENLTWLAVATAPAGFCHVRSSMIGTLLEDIAAGMDFEQVKRRFADKMHPLQYQRPQAAPTAGNIAQAEAIVEKLGIARSLLRRHATLADIQTVWTPKSAPVAQTGDVFGHLKPKQQLGQVVVGKAPPMTWAKFYRDVLPHADQVEYFTQGTNYMGLLTAVDPEAPPILQWDMPDQRNPVSWYVWHGGSTPPTFSLPNHAWVKAAAIALLPPMWNMRIKPHEGEGAIVLLDGARDTRRPSSCLFPEILKGELREVRATIEAYSKSRNIEPAAEQAAGADLRKGSKWEARMRVRSGAVVTEYVVDRWD